MSSSDIPVRPLDGPNLYRSPIATFAPVRHQWFATADGVVIRDTERHRERWLESDDYVHLERAR